jgi:hypothetical protein
VRFPRANFEVKIVLPISFLESSLKACLRRVRLRLWRVDLAAATGVRQIEGPYRRVRLNARLGHDVNVFDLARRRRNSNTVFTQTL